MSFQQISGSLKTDKGGSSSEPCSRWHSLRGKYSQLFDPQVISTVEHWYNTIASKNSRESFQRAAKQILNTEECTFASGNEQLKYSPKDDVKKHTAIHFANLYGKVLSEKGKRLLASWVLVASSSELEDARVSFAAIQANLNQCSATKEAFTPKLPDISSNNKEWNRKKIDWMSQKVHSHMQNTVKDPMRGGIESLPGGEETNNQPKKRFTKPKSQFDFTDTNGADLLKSLGIDEGSGDALASLREKREAASNALLTTRDENGCNVYTCKRAAKAEGRAYASSRNRIVASSSANDTSGWQTTTRETIKDYSGSALSRPMRISPESHPSMTRTTASLGMVVPHPSLQPK